MQDRRVIALSKVECLLIPQYWLMQHNRANIWVRIRQFLDQNIPSQDQIFKAFLEHRKWLQYRQELVREIVSRKKIPNNTTIHDVPYSLRINSDTIPDSLNSASMADSGRDKSPKPGTTPEEETGARKRHDNARSGSHSSSDEGFDQGKRSLDQATPALNGINHTESLCFCRLRTGETMMIPGISVQTVVGPGVAASPPKFVSLEEIMKAAKDIKDMSLVHEIAVDRNFKLEKFEPPPDSIQKQVKDTMQTVFWDILAEQLNADPPSYDQAMVLLAEIKESLLRLLLPQHTKLKQEINEILDVDLIKQQTKAGILDFQYYAHYVISVMGKLCAPVRDDKIQELSQTTEIVPVFKGILETLEIMHIDMANFTIELMRPDLIARSIDYEKTKFAELLKIQPDGLDATRKWVLKHLDTVKASNPQLHSTDKDTIVRILTAKTIAEAYLELLQWDESMPFPEEVALHVSHSSLMSSDRMKLRSGDWAVTIDFLLTSLSIGNNTVMMDEGRFRALGERCLRMTVVGAVLLVTLSSIKQLQGNSAFKELLKQHVTVLLEEAHSNKYLEKLMPNVATQVIKDIDDCLKKIGSSELDAESKRLLSGQILEIASPSHKIRQLVEVNSPSARRGDALYQVQPALDVRQTPQSTCDVMRPRSKYRSEMPLSKEVQIEINLLAGSGSYHKFAEKLNRRHASIRYIRHYTAAKFTERFRVTEGINVQKETWPSTNIPPLMAQY
uniref:T-complex protein 11-like protein 1 n=1 Tax=Timema genevievae TaxID=629358 RepID=A0A7R9JXS9_TIMGE|nr:unnamed protein product [Timema genevievae]